MMVSHYCERLSKANKISPNLQICDEPLSGLLNNKVRIEETGMRATIWHNPGCGTSRGVLEQLQDRPDIDLSVIEYKKHPFTAETLARLFAAAGLTAREALRIQGTEAEALGLTDQAISNAAILDAMVTDPMLVQRPFVETEKGVRLCRPKEKLADIL
jgi:arsenate reductase (glutaredoxin)